MGATLVHIPAWGTVSLVELVWTLIAWVGGVYSFANLSDARALRRLASADTATCLLINTAVRTERVRLFELVAASMVGVFSMTQPQLPGNLNVSVVGLAVILLLVAMLGGITFNSYKDKADREKIANVLAGE